MRLIPSPAPSAAAAKTGLHVHLSPPATTSAVPALPPSDKCDVYKCPWWPYSNSKDFKINTALVLLFLCCTLICGVAFRSAIRYLRMRRQMWTPDNRKAELDRTAAGQEEEIPTLIYAEGMNLAGMQAECAICLSEFSTGDRIRVLKKCSHGFHLQCIDRWLVSHSSCPTCRANSE